MASAETVASPAGDAIAGWENLSLELSAGAAGSRIVQVLLDRTGQPISASDHVLHRSPHPADSSAPAQIEQESVGGRFEADGSFRGTHWQVTGAEPPDGEEPQWTMTPRPPTPAEIGSLRSLVAELLRRERA